VTLFVTATTAGTESVEQKDKPDTKKDGVQIQAEVVVLGEMVRELIEALHESSKSNGD
jgi:hypothetical protein